MPKFKVFGSKSLNFWVDLEAKDGMEAYDKAFELDSIAWNELESDNEIEPVDVYEIEPDIEDEEEEFQFDPINVIGASNEA